jgi:DNA-binding Lrp family transcriptional regulator
LRSAWIPAPPLESEPAMVKAIGKVIVFSRKAIKSSQHSQRGPAGIGNRFSQQAQSRRAFSNATCVLSSRNRYIGASSFRRYAMVPFFVQFKCKLGQSYAVANTLAEAEIASEIYSTAGDYDLLAKFYVDNDTDIGHFINEKVQVIPGIQDTHTIITFKAFGSK